MLTHPYRTHRKIRSMWRTKSIRTKILAPLIALTVLLLLGSHLTFVATTNRTRNRILDEQMNEAASRLQVSLFQYARDVANGAKGLAQDPQLVTAMREESSGQEALLRMDARAVVVRERFHLDQVIVLNTEQQARVNLATDSTLTKIRFYDHESLAQCTTAEQLALIDQQEHHLLVGCAPILAHNPATPTRRTLIGTVYTVLNIPETIGRIRREQGLTTEITFLGNTAALPAPTAADTIAHSRDGYRTRQYTVTVAESEVVLAMRLSEQEIKTIVSSGQTVMLASSILMLLLLVTTIYYLTQRFTRPILNLSKAAREVSRGDLSYQLPVSSHDEIGVLVESFNAMVKGLRERARARQERETAERAREVAQATSRAKSLFLANMSHELRTPLNAILGYSEMLQEDADAMELSDMSRDLQRIQASGAHLLTLINDILDISKIEAEQMTLHLKTVDICRLVAEVADTVRPLAQKNNNSLTVSCSPDLGTMEADQTRMRQVLINLLSNACKFTEQGRVTLNVSLRTPSIEPDCSDTCSLRAYQNTPCVVFAIRDTGIGMTPAQVSKLFHPFTQVDDSPTRKYGGTGLGLAITRRLCLLMGGDVYVESSYGAGSTFTAILPLSFQPPPQAQGKTDGQHQVAETEMR